MKAKTNREILLTPKKSMLDGIKTWIKPGEKGRGMMPWSEVCMHMRVSDTVMEFELLETGEMVQLIAGNGEKFSAPILPGEAGIYQDGKKRLFYYKH